MNDELNFSDRSEVNRSNKQTKILITVGSGGVGKTTLSAAIAAQTVLLSNKKVLVLTMDPSERLKTTLGLSSKGDIIEWKDEDFKGQVFSSIMDAQKTFDDFIIKSLSEKNSQKVKKIFENRLYQQLSTTLSGSQEFSALEYLYSCYETRKYDLIILDTPPTAHAIDFLKAPQKLIKLFQSEVLQWFKNADNKDNQLIYRIFQGSKWRLFNILQFLTGSEFIKELTNFFQQIEQWQSQLEKRVVSLQNLLHSNETHFVLVTSPDETQIKEAIYFHKSLLKEKFHLSHVIINRAYPLWMHSLTHQDKTLQKHPFFIEIVQYYQRRNALKEKYLRSSGILLDTQFQELPEFENEISNKEGVKCLAHYLKQL